MRDCVVMGCGRSGTSMTAGVLASVGYNIGQRLIPADDANPRGYFEDIDVNAVNDELITPHVATDDGHGTLRRPLDDTERWLAALPLDLHITPTPGQQARMTATLRGGPPRCRKDPQFCYTWPAWRPLLPDPVLVCVFREPGRTAQSLSRHVGHQGLGFGFTEGMRLWIASYRHILDRHRHHGQWVFCHYQQVLDGSALPRLEQALGTRLPRDVAEPELRRSPRTQEVPPAAMAMYEQLCALAGYVEPDIALHGS